jgi:glycerol kinase
VILVIDQGTTSTRAIVFGPDAAPVASAQAEFPQIYPRPGWVEHDPEALWQTTVATAREALRRAEFDARDIAAIGIANQRETALIWERATGRPIANAIVWQDRRTAEACATLKAEGAEPQVTAATGLVIDPYFSATKIVWLLDNIHGARTAAERGELAFGTVDTFLLWRLTNGARHATDATNASRTMLYDIRKGAWDKDMLRLFHVPPGILPEVLDTAAEYGASAPEHLGRAFRSGR